MKKPLSFLLLLTFFNFSLVRAEDYDYLEQGNDESNAIYRMDAGCGCEDGVFTATSARMIGWGVGLAAAIALLAGLLHQSRGNAAHDSD